MNDNSFVDLIDFQEKVINEYERLKGIKSAGKIDLNKIKKDFKGSYWGCLSIPVFRIINRFGESTLAKVRREKNYEDFEEYANVLISQNGINQAVCDSIKNLNQNEILTEERFVKLIVETLTENDLRKRFAVHLEPTLFAFIAYIIFQRRLENYCAEIWSNNSIFNFMNDP